MANTELVPYKGGSQGCQMESRNLTVEPSSLIPPNNSGMRSLVTSECGKSKMSEDDNDSTIQPRQPDSAVVLDAATKRRSEVLAPENLENMWAIGRNYQKKMIKVDQSSRLKGYGGSDNSPSAGAVAKELSSNFNERIASVDYKYMVNLMQSKNRNAQSTFVTGSHPLALQTQPDSPPLPRARSSRQRGFHSRQIICRELLSAKSGRQKVSRQRFICRKPLSANSLPRAK